jgi:hypothetical protein
MLIFIENLFFSINFYNIFTTLGNHKAYLCLFGGNSVLFERNKLLSFLFFIWIRKRREKDIMILFYTIFFFLCWIVGGIVGGVWCAGVRRREVVATLLSF